MMEELREGIDPSHIPEAVALMERAANELERLRKEYAVLKRVAYQAHNAPVVDSARTSALRRRHDVVPVEPRYFDAL
jgi:hypothetical protein